MFVEEAITTAPALSAGIPLLGIMAIAVLAWCFARRSKEGGFRSFRGTAAWLVPYAAALALVALACGMGLFADAVWKLAAFTAAAVLLASVAAHRDRCLMVRKARAGAPRLVRHSVAEVAVILAASILAVYALECSYNDWAFDIERRFLAIEFTIVLCAVSFCYLVSGRRGSGAAVGVVALLVVGLAQFFVYSFKLAAIMPADLLVLGTALAVSGNYEYIINGGVLQGVGIALTAITLLAFLAPWKRSENASSSRTGTLIAAAAVAAMLAGFTLIPDYAEDADVRIDSWFTYDCYKQHGFLTSFIAVAQDMVVEKPQDYTAEGTRDMVEESAAQYRKEAARTSGREEAQAQFSQMQPAIVCVMNETFADLSDYDGLRCGYNGPEFFNSLQEEAIASGDCSMSVLGGGTCNSEFEFLTGNNMAFFGQGIYPYSAYNFEGCENLAKQFNGMGYTTTAIHPNFATNWKRDVIYRKMGFGTFLSREDFPEAEMIHNEVSDGATYDRVLEILRNDPSPQFIMDITMQNHSGYARGGLPQEYLLDYAPEGIDDPGLVSQVNEYLGCIKASDDALRDFIGQLRMMDRPVLVVFFGDHQPGFSRDLNDIFYPGEANAEHQQRIYHTAYFVWANYEVAGSERFEDVQQVATSNLSALALEIAGAPLTSYQEMLLQTAKTVPAFNLFGFCDAQGAWYDPDTDKVPKGVVEAVDLLERAQYERFVDKKKK